ncbi:hypothetical protein GCM10011586_30870 [Silvibacterium dinghuense]|nr:hypothetical protein GCM10011586_30870 [Silvibacterium dinghuense]
MPIGSDGDVPEKGDGIAVNGRIALDTAKEGDRVAVNRTIDMNRAGKADKVMRLFIRCDVDIVQEGNPVALCVG